MEKVAETIGIVIGTLLGLIVILSILINHLETKEDQEIIASFTGGMEVIGICEGYNSGVSKQDTFTYYRETTTDVMYICYEEYRKGSLTVMMDPETGLPLTYSRYLELTQKEE